MFKHRRMRAAALALATAIAVPAVSLIAAGSARAGDEASQAAPKYYEGKVLAKALTLRHYPTPASAKDGSFKKGDVIRISCKVKTVNVDGNSLWYQSHYLQGGWLSARYVKNVGKAPAWCKGDSWYSKGTTTKKPSVNLRTGPTNKAKLAGSLKYRTKAKVLCKLNGPKVDGNPRWYQLQDGRWVPARYVKNNGKAPGFCNVGFAD